MGGAADPLLEAEVTAVVPTLAGGAPLAACLRALAAQTRPVAVVVVADGPAAAAAAGPVVAAAGPGVHLVARPRRAGYGPATRAGLDRALLLGARAALLLNDDCLLAPDAVERLLAALADPRVGVAGPVLEAGDGATLDSAGLEVHLLGSGRDALRGAPLGRAPAAAGEVLAVTGAALLARADALRAAGGLDPSWGFYFEDVDLCLAVRDAGFAVALAPDARATHARSASIGRGSPRQAYHLATNQVRLVARAFPLPWALACLPLALGRAALRPLESAARARPAEALAHALAAAAALLRLPRDLAGRRPMRPATFARVTRRWRWPPALSRPA